jgi:hypothetical protein
MHYFYTWVMHAWWPQFNRGFPDFFYLKTQIVGPPRGTDFYSFFTDFPMYDMGCRVAHFAPLRSNLLRSNLF